MMTHAEPPKMFTQENPKDPFILPKQLNLHAYPAKQAIKNSVFIAPTASVLGNIEIGEGCSFWFSAIARADVNHIYIGAVTNIQDACVLHVSNNFACRLSHHITVGHGAIVHACHIDEGVLIGMKSVILDGAFIGKGSIIAAGAVLRQGEQVPPFTLMAGVPAKAIRQLPPSTLEDNFKWAEKYKALAARYIQHYSHV